MTDLSVRWRSSLHEYSYIRQSDMPEIVTMLAKETVCRWLYFGPNTEEMTRSYFDPLLASIDESIAAGEVPRNHVFCIRETASGRFVGQCALLPVEFSEGAYLIGFQLDDTHWGRGIGTEACELLVYLAFRRLGAYRISGDCVVGNEASRRVMLGRGFREEGIRRKYWNFGSQVYDKANFGLLREEMDQDYLKDIESRFQSQS